MKRFLLAPIRNLDRQHPQSLEVLIQEEFTPKHIIEAE
jgi:hypothetical protein